MMYVRFPLSLRNVEDLLHERSIDICHETVRYWWNRFGPLFAAEIRKNRIDHPRSYSNWRWHLDEVFVTDRLRSDRVAMVQLGNAKCQETGRWLNNRGENSHLPFRRREYAMQRFRREKTLQKFVPVYSAVCNHFNHERHLISRDDFKAKREAAFVEWQRLSAA